jgi:hypothetical protein
VALCGWTKDEALKEMTEGGFGFHPVWENLKTYLDKLDVDALKKTGWNRGPAQARESRETREAAVGARRPNHG